MKNISYGSCRNRCIYTILLIYHIIIRDNIIMIIYKELFLLSVYTYVKTQYIVKLGMIILLKYLTLRYWKNQHLP